MADGFDSFPPNPEDGHRLVLNGTVFQFDAVDRAWRVATSTSGGDKDLNQYRITNVQGPRVGGALDPGKYDAVNREYVDQLVASSALYQGTWQPATNIPDLTPRPDPDNPFPLNGYSWIVSTVDPLVPETTPAGLPGIDAVEVRAGDTVKWSTAANEYQLIRAVSFSKADTDKLYAKLLGGFGTYAAGQDYPVGRMVQYNGGFYQVTTAILNAPAIPDDSKWQSFGGILQTDADQRYAALVGGFGTWAAGQHYAVGRILHYDGKLFQVVQDIPISGVTPDHADWKPLGYQQTDYWQGTIPADHNWAHKNWVMLADLPAYFMGEVIVTAYLARDQVASYHLRLMGAFGSVNVEVMSVRSHDGTVLGAAMFSEFRVSAAVRGQPMRLEARIQDAVSTSPTMKIEVAGTTYAVSSSGVGIPDPPMPLPGGADLGGIQYARVPAEPSASIASKVQLYEAHRRYRLGELVAYDNQLFEVTTEINDSPDPPDHSWWKLHGDGQAGYYQGGVLAQTWTANNWALLATLPPFFTGEVLIVADANINFEYATRIVITSIGDKAEMRVLDAEFGRGGRLLKQLRLSRDGGPLRLEGCVGGGSGASVILKIVVKGADTDAGPNAVEMPDQVAALPAGANLGGDELALIDTKSPVTGNLADLLDVDVATTAPLDKDQLTWSNTDHKWTPQKNTPADMATETKLNAAVTALNARIEALIAGMSHGAAVNNFAATPPGDAKPGDLYIVSAGATGDFAGKTNWIAYKKADLTWTFTFPDVNDAHLVEALNETWTWNGNLWAKVGTGVNGSSKQSGVGEIIPWLSNTIPDDYLACDARVLRRAEYPELFAIIGNNFNAGTVADGTNTFALPDLRGHFLRGTGGAGAASPGDKQDDRTRLPRSGFTTSSSGNHSHLVGLNVFSGDANSPLAAGYTWSATNQDRRTVGNVAQNFRAVLPGTNQEGAHTHTVTGGDAETRPVNMSVVWIIRVKAINGGAAGPQGPKGDPAAVGDLWNVGSIQQTILTETQFRMALGLGSTEDLKWVLCDGRNVVGSDYHKLTGQSTVPDLRGAYIRMQGINSMRNGWSGGNLGEYQDDTTRLPRTPFQTSNPGDHTHSYVAQNHSLVGGGSYNVGANDNTRQSGGAGGHTHSISGGDAETRPKTYVVNYMIKINGAAGNPDSPGTSNWVGATELDALTDVTLTARANGHTLVYDSATSKWVNKAPTAAAAATTLAALTDTTVATPVNGQALVYNSATSKWENRFQRKFRQGSGNNNHLVYCEVTEGFGTNFELKGYVQPRDQHACIGPYVRFSDNVEVNFSAHTDMAHQWQVVAYKTEGVQNIGTTVNDHGCRWTWRNQTSYTLQNGRMMQYTFRGFNVDGWWQFGWQGWYLSSNDTPMEFSGGVEYHHNSPITRVGVRAWVINSDTEMNAIHRQQLDAI